MSKGYKIGDACKELDVQPYVLRYWETEFPFLRPEKGGSGPRVYTEAELGLIRRIKELLYDEGYTIAGAKKKLEAEIESGKSPESKQGAAAAPAEEGSSKKAAEQVQRSLADEEEEASSPAEAEPSGTEEAPCEDGTAAAGASLDSASNEQIETIARGLRSLRNEAGELLDLLNGGASNASEE